MNDDGTMARLDDHVVFAQFHNLKIATIADLIAYRRCNEVMVKSIHEDKFTSNFGGEFDLHLYVSKIEYAEHVVLVKGDISGSKDNPVLVRMHSVDVLGDVLGEVSPNGHDSVLQKSMEAIDKEGRGVIVLLRPPNAMRLSETLMKNLNQGAPQKKDDKILRDYGIGAQILLDLGIYNMVLLSSSTKNIVGLDGYDLHITEQRIIS